MKKIVTIIALAFGLMTAYSLDANAQLFDFGRKDVVISYEHLSADASFKQFRQANKSTQTDILNALLRRANEEYRKCETLDDLYEVKEQIELIKYYHNHGSRRKSISIENDINKLMNTIEQTEAEFKGATIIRGDRTQYHHRDD